VGHGNVEGSLIQKLELQFTKGPEGDSERQSKKKEGNTQTSNNPFLLRKQGRAVKNKRKRGGKHAGQPLSLKSRKRVGGKLKSSSVSERESESQEEGKIRVVRFGNELGEDGNSAGVETKTGLMKRGKTKSNPSRSLREKRQQNS